MKTVIFGYVRLAVLAACILLVLTGPGWAKHPGAAAPAQQGQQPPAPPEELSPEQIDAFMAKLSDSQARRILSDRLKEDAAAKKSQKNAQVIGIPALAGLFFSQEQALDNLAQQISEVFSDAEDAPARWPNVWRRISDGQGPAYLLAALGKALLALLAGLLAERLLLRATRPLYDHLQRAIPQGRMQKAGMALTRMVLDALALAGFAAASFLVFVALFERGTPAHGSCSILLIGVYYFRLVRYAARLILSPDASRLGLLGLPEETARFIYRWLMRINFAGLCIGAISAIIKEVGKSRELYMLSHASAGLVAGLLLALMILSCRKNVSAHILREGRGDDEAGPLRRLLADFWHYPALAYALGIGGYWSLRMALHGDVTILSLVLSLFLIPMCIGLDVWMQKLLGIASGEDRQIIPIVGGTAQAGQPDPACGGAAEPDAARSGISYIVPLARKIFRAVLASSSSSPPSISGASTCRSAGSSPATS